MVTPFFLATPEPSLAAAAPGGVTPALNPVRAVAERDVRLVGARDLDPLEAVALANSEVVRLDVASLAGLRLARPVHLHIDNDVLDAAQVPANNYPVAGGPSLDEAAGALGAFVASNRVRALSFSGWAGALDGDGRTARACARLLGAAVGAAAG